MNENIDEGLEQIAITSWFAECRKFADSLSTLEELWDQMPGDVETAARAYSAFAEMHRVVEQFNDITFIDMSGYLGRIVIDLAIAKAVNGEFEGWQTLGIREGTWWHETTWERLCDLGYAERNTPNFPSGWELNERGNALFFPNGEPTQQFEALMTVDDGPPV